MSPDDFEAWVLEKLTEIRWSCAVLVGGRGDRGVDIKGTYRGQPVIVQCKHYTSRKVSPKEIREFLGAMNVHKASRGYFITSGDFTQQCHEEVKDASCQVELWNLDKLLREARQANQQKEASGFF